MGESRIGWGLAATVVATAASFTDGPSPGGQVGRRGPQAAGGRALEEHRDRRPESGAALSSAPRADEQSGGQPWRRSRDHASDEAGAAALKLPCELDQGPDVLGLQVINKQPVREPVPLVQSTLQSIKILVRNDTIGVQGLQNETRSSVPDIQALGRAADLIVDSMADQTRRKAARGLSESSDCRASASNDSTYSVLGSPSSRGIHPLDQEDRQPSRNASREETACIDVSSGLISCN